MQGVNGAWEKEARGSVDMARDDSACTAHRSGVVDVQQLDVDHERLVRTDARQ
jgi:hypothetical protein